MNKYTPIIGAEIHIQLKTKSGMFCGCKNDISGQAKPNIYTCPVCLGLPGALPVPNKKAIDWTILAGLALNCTIAKVSKFDRKHYFYPDLPKGYQISQYDQPLCTNGSVNTSFGKVRINRVHLEEDTAKLTHATVDGKKVSLIDFNRSGTPLMEVVTEPDIHSVEQAKEFLKKLRDIIRSIGVADCDMDKGGMRLEANISLSKDGSLPDYKVEVKNINSFRFFANSVKSEIKRHTSILDKGKTPIQETRGYRDSIKDTVSQRTKETAEDYRYFPDPDIPPMTFSDEEINKIRKKLPKLPDQQISELELPENIAKLLVSKPKNLNYYLDNLNKIKKFKLNNKKFANFIINNKLDIIKPVEPQLEKLTQSSSVDDSILIEVIHENSDVVEKFKAGKTAVIGFLVGQVLKKAKGQADPKQAQKSLLEKLS